MHEVNRTKKGEKKPGAGHRVETSQIRLEEETLQPLAKM